MGEIVFTAAHKTQHTVGPTMSTSMSFTSTVKEAVRKAFTGAKQHPEPPRTTVTSGIDVQFMEQTHENINEVFYTYSSISQ